MHKPELQENPVPALPEEVLLEAFGIAANAEFPQFIHEHSDSGHMFDTGNFGGPEKYYANDAYRTPVLFDFTEFDSYSGESTISTSLFLIDDKCMVSFFNIGRDNGERFTYGLMLDFNSDRDVKELIHKRSDEWGSQTSTKDIVRTSVFSWLVAFQA